MVDFFLVVGREMKIGFLHKKETVTLVNIALSRLLYVKNFMFFPMFSCICEQFCSGKKGRKSHIFLDKIPIKIKFLLKSKQDVK